MFPLIVCLIVHIMICKTNIMASDDRSHQIGVRLLIVDEQQTKTI